MSKSKNEGQKMQYSIACHISDNHRERQHKTQRNSSSGNQRPENCEFRNLYTVYPKFIVPYTQAHSLSGHRIGAVVHDATQRVKKYERPRGVSDRSPRSGVFFQISRIYRREKTMRNFWEN